MSQLSGIFTGLVFHIEFTGLIRPQGILRIIRSLIRMTADSLVNEPLSRTIFRVKTYLLEPYRFRLLDTTDLPGYASFLSGQYALAKHRLEVDKLLKTSGFKPLISVVIPVYNTSKYHLQACVESVMAQWYSQIEILLYDDGSDSAETLFTLNNLVKRDQRIRLLRSKENKHISHATNTAIQNAKGEYIALVDHDDLLEPFALFEVVIAINRHDKPDLIYSDEDKIDSSGRRFGPYFKSDFDQDLLLSNNYINHLVVVKKSAGDRIAWFRVGYEGAQDHDFLLRLADETKAICHIPKVLYSWRMHADSTAMAHDQKPYALDAGKRAVVEYLIRNQIAAKVIYGPWLGSYRIKRESLNNPLVSIIIPFKDQAELTLDCLKGIFEQTSYDHFEVILVNNNSREATLEKLKAFTLNSKVKWHNFSQPFNFSAINNDAARVASGDLLLFLNNDTRVINSDWLDEMVSQIERPEVGVVGANLRYADDTIQHQGVVLGIGGFAGHVFRHLPADECRHFSQGLVRQYSAVTGACMMTNRHLFLRSGGFDEENLAIALNDVDYCLKIKAMGYKVIYTPYAMLYHLESKSRGYEDNPEKIARLRKEVDYFVGKWSQLVKNDPFYNSNLTLEREDMGLR